MTVALPVLFACVPLGSRMTRSACGKRHLAANGPPPRQGFSVRDETCKTCAVGVAHAKGETAASWPDGAPVTTAIAGVGQPPASRPLAPPPPPRRSRFELPPAIKRAVAPVTAVTRQPITSTESPMTNPQRKMYTHDGKTLSLDEWAARVGVRKEALRMRIAKGWPLERAFSKNPGPRQMKPRKDAIARAGTTLKPPIAKGPAIATPITAAKMRRLARPIEAKSTLLRDGRTVATPEEALLAFGYTVAARIDTPRGLALIVEDPS